MVTIVTKFGVGASIRGVPNRGSGMTGSKSRFRTGHHPVAAQVNQGTSSESRRAIAPRDDSRGGQDEMLTSLWTWRRLFQLRPSGFDEDAGNRQHRVSGAPWYCPGGGRRSPAADRTRVRDQPASPRCEAQTTDFADDLLPSPSSQARSNLLEVPGDRGASKGRLRCVTVC